MKKLTNEEFQNRLLSEAPGIFTDDIYKTIDDVMEFYCEKLHRWRTSPDKILNRHDRCPYCSGLRPIIGETDLWTTRPDIARLLKNPEDGYILKEYSKKKTDFVCPICGNIIRAYVFNVSRQGLSCKACSDGVSYPNKFARNLLKQLNVCNIVYEYSPDWIKPYLYDNYFEYNGKRYILEMDGGIGHGHCSYDFDGADIIGCERDNYKDSQALSHDIFIIRVDCNYGNNDRFEYIKNNIMNSCISEIFDLSGIDWNMCHYLSLCSLVKTVSDFWNDGHTIQDIVDDVHYSRITIRKWLKQAAQSGLCGYTPIESKMRNRKNLKIAINQYDELGNFIASYDSQAAAFRETGIAACNISSSINGRQKNAGGFIWYKADDPDQPDKSKIIHNNTKLIKEVS